MIVKKKFGIYKEYDGIDKLFKKFGSNIIAISGINIPIPNISNIEVITKMQINIYKEKGWWTLASLKICNIECILLIINT